MKTYKYMAIAAVALSGMWLQSCSDELELTEGQGQLKIKMMVNSELTRAETDEHNLAESLILHLENADGGVIRKFEGMSDIPSDLWLKSGSYTARAWAGDSVSASFDKKAYKAVQPFDIHAGVNNLLITCRVANTVVSVNPAGVPTDIMRDWTLTVSSSRASLGFTADNAAEAHGYFMMPWPGGVREDVLNYTIKGKTLDGSDFSKSGSINGVKPTHEYVLNLQFNPEASPNDVGGAFINVVVDDTEILIEDQVTIEAAPHFGGINFDMEKGVSGSTETEFTDIYISGACYGTPSSVVLSVSDRAAFGLDYDAYDLLSMGAAASDELETKNLTYKVTPATDGVHSQLRISFPGALLNNLPNGTYSIGVQMTDGYSPARTRSVEIPVVISDAKVRVLPIDLSAVRSYSAPVTLSIIDSEATGAGLRFRPKGSSTWTEATATRAESQTFRLTGLAPATTYQVQAYCDGFESSEIQEFTTDAAFALPNASFEEWSTCNDLINNTPFPGSGSVRTFWDTGNHGSMSMGKSITSKSDVMKHSGQYSAELYSQFVGIGGSIGKFAAGNIFSGTYDQTVGTSGGILTVGRPMDRCHPVKLTGWANYRPVAVTHAESGAPIQKGDMDRARVWVAVVKQPVTINIAASPRILFDESADYVLALGDVVWTSNFGPDGQMQQFEVNIDWRNPGYTGQYYIVVMGAASMYGDYFTGGNGSKLYLDDLELIYE